MAPPLSVRRDSSLPGSWQLELSAEPVTLLRAHAPPFLPEFLSAFGRLALEPLTSSPQPTLFLARQLAKALKALPNALLLLGRELLPLTEVVLRAPSFLGAHLRPPVGTSP